MNLGGVRGMQRPPDAAFIVDLKTEAIAVREAQRLRIPIIGLVDTNVDPEPVTYPIPGNDDAIRSCKVIVDAIASVVGERHAQFRAEEEKARQEAEEKARREAEEKARREAEERAREEAQAAAREAQQAQAQQQQQAQPAQQQQAQPAQQQQQAQPAQQPQQERRQPSPRPAPETVATPAPKQETAAPGQPHGGAARAGDPDPQTAPQQVEPVAASAPARGGAEVREASEHPAREEVERAERDKKAPLGETRRPRDPEEADVKAAEQREEASRPDQEVG